MSENRVSVIIPAYNAAASLGRCIDSALAQELQPAEVIVVNDGSTDKTGDVAKAYGQSIVYIEQDNQGQGAARNTGLRNATGEYIAFLDADDYWLPGFLKATVNFLNVHKDAVAVMTAWLKKIDDKTEIVVPPIMTSTVTKELHPEVLDNFFDFWAEQGNVQTGAIVIRHDTIRKAGMQRADLRNSQDWEHWALIATYGKWGFLPEVLYVNNSRLAARGNWIKKYATRRKLCPTVEEWEKRLIPRLRECELPAFKKIRGTVAAGYAHNKILGENLLGARRIVNKYGDSMPDSKLVRLLRAGDKIGFWGWWIACQIIRLKEYTKAI